MKQQTAYEGYEEKVDWRAAFQQSLSQIIPEVMLAMLQDLKPVLPIVSSIWDCEVDHFNGLYQKLSDIISTSGEASHVEVLTVLNEALRKYIESLCLKGFGNAENFQTIMVMKTIMKINQYIETPFSKNLKYYTAEKSRLFPPANPAASDPPAPKPVANSSGVQWFF